MHTLKQHENGRTVFGIIRTMALLLSVITVFIIIFRLFWGVLFYDTAADDTVKELSSRAVTLSGQILNGQTKLSNGEYGLKTRKGYIATSYLVQDNFFEITLTNVPLQICQRILKKNWTMPTSIYVNDILDQFGPVLCKDTNKMSFEFSRDLSENIPNSEKPHKHHCISDATCSGCGACRDGLCQTGCTDSEQCALTLTTQSVCCSAEKYTQGMCCSFVEDGNCCWGRGKCCPFDKPIYTSDGRCVDCYDSVPFAVGESANLDTCETLCPNRISFGQDNLCMLPICQEGQFMGQDGVCYPCDQEGGILTSEKECQKCSVRSFQDGLCQHTCPANTFQDKQGTCISCSELQAIDVGSNTSCTTTCPNRSLKEQKCVLTICPEQTISDEDGSCFPCDFDGAIRHTSAEQCANCPARIFQDGVCQYPCPDNYFRSSDGVCHSCSDKAVYPITLGSSECSKCPNRLFLNNYCFASCQSGQFRDALGSCHDCQDPESALILQTSSCSLCPNRAVILKQNGKENLRYCAPQYCPLNYFRDTLGGCHDCEITDAVFDITKDACEQCPNRMWSPLDNSCRIKPSCPVGEVLDSLGKCHSCSETNAFQLKGYLENCEYCPNRYLYGTWCRTCPANNGTLTTKESCQKCGGSWDNRVERCH